MAYWDKKGNQRKSSRKPGTDKGRSHSVSGYAGRWSKVRRGRKKDGFL